VPSIVEQWPLDRLREQYGEFRQAYFGDRVPPASAVKFRWNGRLTASAGRCGQTGSTATIELSPHYHERHPDEVTGTLLHEMIHLVVPGHGPEFKKWVQRLRQEGESVRRHAKERATPPQYRYFIRCASCGERGRRFQRWSKTLERVSSQPEKYRCRSCETVGTLVVMEYRQTDSRR
jgi:predicted SprT family Zn-dependent metalloprotease